MHQVIAVRFQRGKKSFGFERTSNFITLRSLRVRVRVTLL
jgi:hypothetical protein